jgi:cephalosporin hydroxylase
MFRRTPKAEQIRFDYRSIDAGHNKVSYRGIQAQRSPFDYVIYQMIISALQPDLVIEIGTRYGGGALYFADLMNNIGKGHVHSIDITDECSQLVKSHSRIKLFHEGWQNYDLSQTRPYENILVVDDASHHYDETLPTLNKFSSVVSVGSYLIVEDGIIDKLGLTHEYNGGPCRAIREFLKGNSQFQADRQWCDFFGKNATNNVNGYLKRIS